MVGLESVHVKEMQTFTTYADPYETVGGHWSLFYEGRSTLQLFLPAFNFHLGITRNIPASATVEQVQTAISEDLPELGRVLVTREPYDFCACTGGYTWTFTFDELEGDIRTFVPDISSLTGTGANATEIKVLQESPVLGGTFTLSYDG
ncbi:unnamed protein product, partial [Discosporangium mesarthrocarpum]